MTALSKYRAYTGLNTAKLVTTENDRGQHWSLQVSGRELLIHRKLAKALGTGYDCDQLNSHDLQRQTLITHGRAEYHKSRLKPSASHPLNRPETHTQYNLFLGLQISLSGGLPRIPTLPFCFFHSPPMLSRSVRALYMHLQLLARDERHRVVVSSDSDEKLVGNRIVPASVCIHIHTLFTRLNKTTAIQSNIINTIDIGMQCA